MIAFLLPSGSVAVSDDQANAEALAASLGATAWREVDSLPDAPQEQWVWTDAGALGVGPVDPDTRATEVRAERDSKLTATDWMALSDVAMSPEWATYRQALRDVPAQAGFPETIDWPVAPE